MGFFVFMSFHDQETIKCNGRVSDGVRVAFINTLHCTTVAVLSLFVKAVICFPSWSGSYDHMMYVRSDAMGNDRLISLLLL